jgi:phosphate transport system substrate-binding protein
MTGRASILSAALCAVLLISSCSGGAGSDTPEAAPPIITQPEPTEPSAPSPAAEPPAAPDVTPPAELAVEWAALRNKIDGSTATIPLTEALHGAFGGAGAPPEHHTTPFAYYHLFDGAAELIFVTYPSENELAMARERGIELDIIPIVKDALVFLVNAENPADDVALDAIRAVYTGEITNWKALGGLDAPITAYQRTPDSGSQTLLTKLVMDGREPMRPPAEWIAESMGSLVEVVSGYDNARDAVGYSMFYYVNNMYGNERFKLLGVDGVKPSRETITRGEYPLEDYYYAVMRRDTPADAPARKLTQWLLTDGGQVTAARAGYIPLRPIENVFPDETIDPVYLGDTDNSSGTGGVELKPADAIGEIVTGGVRKPLSDMFFDEFNYIRYINSEIISFMDSPQSVYQYSEMLNFPTLAENVKRPFAGVPNDYPHYELVEYYDHSRYIRIVLPEGNPYFNGTASFDIRLTPDISPYGTSMANDGFSVLYRYDRRMTPNVDLFTLEIDIPRSPEVSERINRQLKAWTDGFPGSGEAAALLDSFVEHYTYDWEDDYFTKYAYRMQPVYGQWNGYLSVSYPLQTYDGPSSHMPTLYTICFDMDTGEAVELAERLPRDIPYTKGWILEPITEFEAGTYTSQTYYENYVPAEGAVVTSAWLQGSRLGMYVTEPDGRALQVGIDNFGLEERTP